MKSLFPGYEGLVDVTDQMITEYTQKITEYFKKYKEIINSFCIDLFVNENFKVFPEELLGDVDSIFAS